MKKLLSNLSRLISHNRLGVKFISFALAMLVLFMIIPVAAYADAIEDFNQQTEGSIEDEQSADVAVSEAYDGSFSYVNEVYEVEELREENTKHFRIEDGTYVAAQYDYPVHYLEDDVYKDIDNALYESSGGVFANSNSRIKFQKKITGNQSLFTLHDGHYKIEMSLNGAIKGTVGAVTNLADSEEETVLQKMMNLEKISSSIIYKDILDGVDVEYVATSLNVKENIIVKAPASGYAYSFELKLNGLSAQRSENGSIIISDEKTLEEKYVIPAPTVFDSSGIYAPLDKSSYTLTDGGNGKYTLTVTVDSSWMNSEERVFPVTVDPSVTASNSNVQDTSIAPIIPDVPIGEQTQIHVTESYICYWKTTVLPSLPRSSYIYSATITMYSSLSDGDFVAAYEVLTDWDENLTWEQYTDETSPKGQMGERVIDYNSITLGSYVWTITPLVRKWYNGENYGVGFRGVSGYPSPALSFGSSEDPGEAYRPKLVISYVNMNGIEDYWPYSSHSVGIAGNGSVNLANGNLVFSIPTLTTTDEVFSFTPTLVYNSDMRTGYYGYGGSAYSLPYGFKWNMQQQLFEKSYTNLQGEEVEYFQWQDADGTVHDFYPDSSITNLYHDDSGKRLRLEIVSQSTVKSTATIENDEGIKYTFQKNLDNNISWVLSEISDYYGNRLAFVMDSQYRITSVRFFVGMVDTQGIEMLRLYYGGGNGLPSIIYNPVSYEAVIFMYSDTFGGSISRVGKKFLRQMLLCHGTSHTTDEQWQNFAENLSFTSESGISLDATASYGYDPSGRLVYVADNKLKRTIGYSWDNYDVVKIGEYSTYESVDTLGQEIGIEYNYGYTDVRSTGNDEQLGTADDMVTRYTFDLYGKQESVYTTNIDGTEIYGAVSGKYEDIDNAKNSLKQSVELGVSNANKIVDGGFEFEGLYHFIKTSSVTVESNEPISGNASAKLMPTVQTHARLRQQVHLVGGTYTLSFLYRGTNTDNLYAEVSVLTNEKIMLYSYNMNIRNTAPGTEDVFSVTFDVENASYGSFLGYVSIDIIIDGDEMPSPAPCVLVDNMMLEYGASISGFNQVLYGDFDTLQAISNGNDVNQYGSFWSQYSNNSSGATYQETEFGNSMRVNGNLADSYAYQTVYYDGSVSRPNSYGKKQYYVSGFGKSEYAFIGGVFEIKVRVGYTMSDGSAEPEDDWDVFHFSYTHLSDKWQFVDGVFTTETFTPDPDSDAVTRMRVREIRIQLEYSEQPVGYALFDNISFVECTESESVINYEYYDNGLLKSADYGTYKEYYQYNFDYQVSHIANNRGEFIEYIYNNVYETRVSEARYYEFTYGTDNDYPIDNPALVTEKVPKIRIGYFYDNVFLIKKITEAVTLSDLGVVVKDYDIPSITETYTYDTEETSRIFGKLLVAEDSSGIRTRNIYDESSGRLLATVNENDGTGIVYTYDALGRLTNARSATYSEDTVSPVTNAESATYTYDARNLLSAVTTETCVYTFTYDKFGNGSSLAVGSDSIVSYEYYPNNGKLKKILYGNGYCEEYFYNNLELLSEVWYNGSEDGGLVKRYSYKYYADGALYKYTDHINGSETVYVYDLDGRPVNSVTTNSTGNRVSAYLHYNAKGLVSDGTYTVDIGTVNQTVFQEYGYNPDGTLDKTELSTAASDGSISYSYDDYWRLTGIHSVQTTGGTGTSGFENIVTNTYETTSYGTSSRVKTYTTQVNDDTPTVYTFEYDEKGNITKIVYDTGVETRYFYDDLGQLIREDSGLFYLTFVYEYDNAGNLLRRVTRSLTDANTQVNVTGGTVYGYTDSEWGDLLTSYAGNTITYDQNGNPISYYNSASYTFSWEGRQLVGASYKGKTLSFVYNSDGIRTSKTVNGVTTTYYLDGSRIIGEETGGNVTVYIYDAEGSPIGMQYHGSNYDAGEWDVYWYEKNMQGDVIAVYDESGAEMMSYKYDAWGMFIETVSSDAIGTAAQRNPFRYRGYYYDIDLGLYYLDSRYYDQNTCRFINADGYVNANGDLVGFNMFAYCSNNPVMFTDPSGEGAVWDWIKEHSFAYNVIVKSTTLRAGAGVGIMYPIPFFSAGSKAQYAVELYDGEIRTGEVGETSVTVGAPPIYFTYGNFSYTGKDGEDYERTEGDWDVEISASKGLSYTFSLELSASISLKKLVTNFINYVNKHWR